MIRVEVEVFVPLQYKRGVFSDGKVWRTYRDEKRNTEI